MADDGERLYCTTCSKSVLLPYTNFERTEVSIVEMDGWTSPPLRCPQCSAAAEAV